ncbi:hypothetical protein AK812_SmicGene42414 [Symbiodinium microadriaticum]|uniref:Uncharacterized protein n=1 Tax=Symbiodinium microadriaticum TaxID=2951 RepID=A0A1Q9C3M0_SYMMI|nr:hypothetical protein AK812_SmicGene42414 [Symbiodinium microadriaticum]
MFVVPGGAPGDAAKSARQVYRSFCPLPVKLLPGVRREAELNHAVRAKAPSDFAGDSDVDDMEVVTSSLVHA